MERTRVDLLRSLGRGMASTFSRGRTKKKANLNRRCIPRGQLKGNLVSSPWQGGFGYLDSFSCSRRGANNSQMISIAEYQISKTISWSEKNMSLLKV